MSWLLVVIFTIVMVDYWLLALLQISSYNIWDRIGMDGLQPLHQYIEEAGSSFVGSLVEWCGCWTYDFQLFEKKAIAFWRTMQLVHITLLFNLKFDDFSYYISGAGDSIDVVVPFMGESITDGTLAKFLKSMFFKYFSFLLLACFFIIS